MLFNVSGTSFHQPSIYAAIQAIPRIMASRKEQEETVSNDQSKIKSETVTNEEKRPQGKIEEPSEDKSKNIKAKLNIHLKQLLPKIHNTLNAEMIGQHDAAETKEQTDEPTLKHINVQPIDDNRDLTAEQSEDDPYVVHDKQAYMKPSLRKTVKTRKIGDEKKNVYPKDDIKRMAPDYNVKYDLETDNTVWIGYGLGSPLYKYPYNYPSSLYSNYGSPYSGWRYNRGYSGGSYYGGYLDRTGLEYAGAYNNYGTGYGPYGGYL